MTALKPLKVFLISLDENRRFPLEKMLCNNKQIDLQIMKGVVGNFNHLVDSEAFSYVNKREILSGEVGCYLAHQTIYQEMVAREIDWALVLEDNVRFEIGMTTSFFEFINYFLNSRFYSSRNPTVIHCFPKAGNFVASKAEKVGDVTVLKAITLPRQTKAYLINYSAAEKAASSGLPIRDVADWPEWASYCNFYVCMENWFQIDKAFASQIDPLGIRLSHQFDALRKPDRLIVHFLSILLGFEYRAYSKHTKRKDYFRRIFISRLAQYTIPPLLILKLAHPYKTATLIRLSRRRVSELTEANYE